MNPSRQITVYTSPSCVQCAMTKRKLDELGVHYAVVDLAVPEHAEAHTYVTGVLGYKAAPVVAVYLGAENDLADHWQGYQPERLEALA
ncbi:glutaredoxin family protein [Microbacterium sp. B24]|uniref:glutaredoxin family protein n=1 Tax=Microbacterium sp. B24 TaxID=95616 RepID=UPI0004205A59|nr:glutaredoxin family protein [Microbacterium sp. B24]